MREVITGPIGTAIKDNIGYTIKSTVHSWKLVKNISTIKVEYVLSKRDFPEFKLLKDYLQTEGYQVL